MLLQASVNTLTVHYKVLTDVVGLLPASYVNTLTVQSKVLTDVVGLLLFCVWSEAGAVGGGGGGGGVCLRTMSCPIHDVLQKVRRLLLSKTKTK